MGDKLNVPFPVRHKKAQKAVRKLEREVKQLRSEKAALRRALARGIDALENVPDRTPYIANELERLRALQEKTGD